MRNHAIQKRLNSVLQEWKLFWWKFSILSKFITFDWKKNFRIKLLRNFLIACFLFLSSFSLCVRNNTSKLFHTRQPVSFGQPFIITNKPSSNTTGILLKTFLCVYSHHHQLIIHMYIPPFFMKDITGIKCGHLAKAHFPYTLSAHYVYLFPKTTSASKVDINF